MVKAIMFPPLVPDVMGSHDVQRFNLTGQESYSAIILDGKKDSHADLKPVVGGRGVLAHE
jgi:hypothetical protein